MSDQEQPQQRVINIDQAEFMDWGKGEDYQAKMARLSFLIGAQKLGFNMTRLEPGKSAFPYHLHHNNEELFIILEGTGTARMPDGEHALRRGDLLLCPPGPDGAHKITNDGEEDLVYLAVSTSLSPEVVEYPDSNKCLAFAGTFPDNVAFRGVFKQDTMVDYWDGEATD
ncbi:MAG: cupin domain-containing protein [Acidobacteria bacterium]|nr:cupin domain-containing protein [Acidobacteriota bacterium]